MLRENFTPKKIDTAKKYKLTDEKRESEERLILGVQAEKNFNNIRAVGLEKKGFFRYF